MRASRARRNKTAKASCQWRTWEVEGGTSSASVSSGIEKLVHGSPGRSLGGGLGSVLRGVGGRGVFGRGILGSALGLKLGGVEDAVVAEGSDGEGLGVVLECVGRRVFAFVVDVELIGVLDQNELGVGAGLVDGAGLDVSGDAQVARVGLVAHGVEFLNGDVVALIGTHAGVGQIGDSSKHNDDGNCDFRALAFALHNGTSVGCGGV